jgi:hypothetical protein
MSESTNVWQPGMPIKTRTDVAAWEAWRKAHILADQRARRAKLRRIDYYPSDNAAAIIDACYGNRARFGGGDYSSVISRIIEEWVDLPE